MNASKVSNGKVRNKDFLPVHNIFWHKGGGAAGNIPERRHQEELPELVARRPRKKRFLLFSKRFPLIFPKRAGMWIDRLDDLRAVASINKNFPGGLKRCSWYLHGRHE